MEGRLIGIVRCVHEYELITLLAFAERILVDSRKIVHRGNNLGIVVENKMENKMKNEKRYRIKKFHEDSIWSGPDYSHLVGLTGTFEPDRFNLEPFYRSGKFTFDKSPFGEILPSIECYALQLQEIKDEQAN